MHDDENQLLSVSSANQWKEEFTYDGRGRMRVKKDFTWNGTSWVFNAEVRYVYDGMLIVQERSSGNHPLVTYTRGTDLSGDLEGAGGIGGLLGRGVHGGSPGFQLSTAAHYHADGNGNVTMLVGTGSPTIKGYYRYDPFGRTLASGGTLANANAMRFSSKPAMGNSELYYYGYRFYDPSSQRWLNRDPAGELGGIHLYGILQNDAITGVDATGLVRWGQIGAGAMAIGGGVGLILLTPVLAPVAVIAAGVAGVTAVALGTANVVVGATEQGPRNIPNGICAFTGYLADRAWNPEMTPEEIGIGQEWSRYGDYAIAGARGRLQWQHEQGWIGWIKGKLK